MYVVQLHCWKCKKKNSFSCLLSVMIRCKTVSLTSGLSHLESQSTFIRSTTWVNSSTSPSLFSLPPWDPSVPPSSLRSLTLCKLSPTCSSPSVSPRSIWPKDTAETHWSVHATGATVISTSASEMLVGAGTRTRADLALRRVLSSFSLNYERDPERWKQVNYRASAHKRMHTIPCVSPPQVSSFPRTFLCWGDFVL